MIKWLLEMQARFPEAFKMLLDYETNETGMFDTIHSFFRANDVKVVFCVSQEFWEEKFAELEKKLTANTGK